MHGHGYAMHELIILSTCIKDDIGLAGWTHYAFHSVN